MLCDGYPRSRVRMARLHEFPQRYTVSKFSMSTLHAKVTIKDERIIRLLRMGRKFDG